MGSPDFEKVMTQMEIESLPAEKQVLVNQLLEKSLDSNLRSLEDLVNFFPNESKDLLILVSKLLFETMKSRESDTTVGYQPKPLASDPTLEKPYKPTFYSSGDTVGDFKIEREIGEGSYARVYLANQISLNRKVALKISPYHGQEATNLAQLEHEGIVQVYSQFVSHEKSQNIICMQYVPGLTLHSIIKQLYQIDEDKLCGKTFLDILDEKQWDNVVVDPTRLKEREFLKAATYEQACLWFCKKLADALSFSHEREILHLDIKPGNILVGPLGRPHLVDFNISLAAGSNFDSEEIYLGGTLKYTSPEQKLAFQTADRHLFQDIDARSDIYSLGFLLSELLELSPNKIDLLEAMVLKAKDVDRNRRFSSMAEFSSSLEYAIDYLQSIESLPAKHSLIGWVDKKPALAISLACLIPQILGSVFNISYNSITIIGGLTQVQNEAFQLTALIYNIVLYPLAISLFLWKVKSFVKNYQTQEHLDNLAKAKKLVDQGLTLPKWLLLATSIGWIPGCFAFAFGIDVLAGPVASSVYLHFAISCLTSWFVVFAYSFLFFDFIFVERFFPQIVSYQRPLESDAKERTFKRVNRHLSIIFSLASIIPLVGASIAIITMGDTGSTGYLSFKILTLLLIFFGALGVMFTRLISKKIRAVLGAFRHHS